MKLYITLYVYILLLSLFKNSILIKDQLETLTYKTKEEGLHYLDQYTKQYRLTKTETTGEHYEIDLCDFFASAEGKEYILNDNHILKIQKGLENLDRDKICQNLKQAYLNNDLLKAKNCFCNKNDPILHCLAIASKVLMSQGEEEEMKANALHLEKPNELENSKYNSRKLKDVDVDILGICFPLPEINDLGCVISDCDIGIYKLLALDIETEGCLGNDDSIVLNMEECQQCILDRHLKNEITDCQAIDFSSVDTLVKTVENAHISLTTSLCVDFIVIGKWLSSFFGVKYCIYEITGEWKIYEETFGISTHMLEDEALEIYGEFLLKLSNGPDCLCKEKTFENYDFCKLNKFGIYGEFGVKADFYFYETSFKAVWNGDEFDTSTVTLQKHSSDDDVKSTSSSESSEDKENSAVNSNIVNLCIIIASFILIFMCV